MDNLKEIKNDYLSIKYEETKDQLSIVVDVKKDYQKFVIEEIYDIFYFLIENKLQKNITMITANSDMLDILEVVYNALGFEINQEFDTHTEWRRTKQAFLHKSKDVFEIAKESDDILDNLSNAIDLYLHEDNLNWTKLAMLVSFTFAFMTAFFVLFEQPYSIVNSALSIFLISFGIFITYMFDVKIKSGQHYMSSHKKKVQKIERILQYFKPNHVMLINIQDSKISNTSVTLQFMKLLPQISYAVWIVCYLLVFYKIFIN